MNDVYSYGDLIVDEEVLKSKAEQVKQCCDELDNTYNEYIKILTGIKDEAIISGETHEAIIAFLELAEGIKKQFEEIGGAIKVDIDVFITNVDEADQYLY